MVATAHASPSVYEFSAEDLHGNMRSLHEFAGRVLLIVNIASKCRFTSQLKGLQALHEKYGRQGLSVLGFPSNQFANQEPATASEIEQFCDLNYGVRFPLFAKIDVNGPSAHPLFRYLATEKPGLFGLSAIKWNFTKFLLDRQGKVIARFAPTTSPFALEIMIGQVLEER